MEFNKLLKYVPSSSHPALEQIEQIAKFITSCTKLLILTGAGISTESGIPDYRSQGVGLYARKSSGPMNYQTFLKSPNNRQRYWARNYVSWPVFSSTVPNIAHNILTKWESTNKIFYTISQNVDNLHIKSGLKKLVEFHGNTHSVVCTNCNFKILRHQFQDILNDMNPCFAAEFNSSNVAPDGDIILDDELVKSFQFPDCFKCHSILKPDIVFFGDNIPKLRKEFVNNLVNLSDGLLCLGSSLETFSSYNIVKSCFDRNVPIGIVNIGDTRADKFANFRLRAQLGLILPKIDQIISL